MTLVLATRKPQRRARRVAKELFRRCCALHSASSLRCSRRFAAHVVRFSLLAPCPRLALLAHSHLLSSFCSSKIFPELDDFAKVEPDLNPSKLWAYSRSNATIGSPFSLPSTTFTITELKGDEL